MKNKLIVLSLFVLFIITFPSINAITVKKTKDENEKSRCFGTIYGNVFGETGGYPAFIPFARIEIEGLRRKHCDLFGGFVFTGLSLDRMYKVTADANGYEEDTKTVTLTKDEPCKDIMFVLLKDPDEKIKKNMLPLFS